MMRKLLPSLLAVLLAVSLLTSCLTIPEIPSSEDPSDAVSGEPEPSGSEDVSSSESQEESQTEVLIEYETIVSVGKSYDMTKEPDDKYPDPGHAKLTDGLYADSASYTDEHYAGFQVSAASVRITLDMEEDGNQLYKFGISYLSTNDAGLGPIGACRVFYSLDGEKWTRTNFFIRPTYEEGTKQTAWLTLDTPVNARFVRFDIKGEKGWLFMDELIVVANVKGSSASSNYQTVLRQSYTAASVDPDGLAPGTGKADRVTFTPYQVTNGARYTTSYDSSERYPDKDDLLTDGEDMGRGISSGEYAGYEGGEELNIDVFLNDPVDGICDFALSMYQQSSLGYRLPYYVDFSVSDDGKTYSRVGRVFAPDDPSVTNFIFTLRTESTYSALWIRYSLPKTDSKLFLIEEAYAAAYIPNPNEPLYPEVVIEPTEEPENWPSQNKKTVNLAAGLSYQIEAFETLYAQDETQHNTLASAGVLTDGVYSPNTVYDNGCWNRTRHGSGRNVYFDLGYVSSITGFKANYLNYPSYGIYAASQTTFCVSMNGIDWYKVGVASLNKSEAPGKIPVEFTLKTPVAARYVMVSFPVSPHTYCDEIEILGAKALLKNAKRPEEHDQAAKTNSYLAPDASILSGTHDAVLIYHNIVDANEDFFLPYVAYLNSEGNIKDTMFDGYLFLPSTASLPSGGHAYDSAEKPNVWSDWEFLYTELFKDGKNFDALNKTVGTVKEALGLPEDYKVNVITTLMYLNPESKNFGDCDGDGNNEDLSTAEGRLHVISYTMNRYLDTFREKNYEHLQFAGFYWFHEAADYEKDAATIKGSAELAAGLGVDLCWIPYYQARSYDLWADMGFDCAVMQPNYVFKEEVPYSQLVSAASLIRNNGMGIEIEISARALSSQIYTERYLAYLGYGLEAGYMSGCIHMYYQEGSVFRTACKSKSPLERIIYDATYRFIKGTLTGPEKPEDMEISVLKDGVSDGSLWDAGELGSAELLTSAAHGSVSLAPNGSYVYVPYKGYTGSDSFTFRVSNAIGWSEPVTVRLNVS